MVVGLGILGQMSVQLLRIAGAAPVIAVNHGEARRNMALKLGADLAFNPADEDYEEKVKAATDGKGVAAMIEVTGKGSALNQSLRCMAKMGRVALLGCKLISITMCICPALKCTAHTHLRAQITSPILGIGRIGMTALRC